MGFILGSVSSGSNLQREKIGMNKLMTMARQFRDDEDGAAMVEYTVLLGLILSVGIAVIAAVGLKLNNYWIALNTAINNTAPTP